MLMDKYVNMFVNNEEYKMCSEKLKQLMVYVFKIFNDNGFEFYPEWRNEHNVNGKKVFLLKALNPRKVNSDPNIVTIYPMSDWLKIEVYYGQRNKHYYDIRNINDVNKEMVEDAWSIYKGIAHFEQETNVEIKSIAECPFSIGEKIVHRTKYGPGVVQSIDKESNTFTVVFENNEIKKFLNENVSKYFSA